MAKVVDQSIPSEFYDLYTRYLRVADDVGRVGKNKTYDGRTMTDTLRVVAGLFREGVRMWKTKTKDERQPWVDAGAAWGLDGQAYFLKCFLSWCFSRGPFKVGTFTVPGWGEGDSQWVGARNRVIAGQPDVILRPKFQIGFSFVGGEAAIS